LTDPSITSRAPGPDSAVAASATSLLHAAIGSVLRALTTEKVHASSEKETPSGAEEAPLGRNDALLRLEAPEILSGEPILLPPLNLGSFPLALHVYLDEAPGSVD